jgi:hypothetical protein
MADVILKYATQLSGRDDTLYAAQACGHQRADTHWEGWLEFTPLTGSGPVTAGKEIVEANRAGLEQWANGLTESYLDAALLRALHRHRPGVVARTLRFLGGVNKLLNKVTPASSIGHD